jgi:hypothetical protein
MTKLKIQFVKYELSESMYHVLLLFLSVKIEVKFEYENNDMELYTLIFVIIVATIFFILAFGKFIIYLFANKKK